MLSLPRARVQSLVGELRSHKLRSTAKKEKKQFLSLIFTILHIMISTYLLKFLSPAPSLQLFLLIITSPWPSPSVLLFFLAIFSPLLMLLYVPLEGPFSTNPSGKSSQEDLCQGALLKLFSVRNTTGELKQRPLFSSILDSSFIVVQRFWHIRKGWFLLCPWMFSWKEISQFPSIENTDGCEPTGNNTIFHTRYLRVGWREAEELPRNPAFSKELQTCICPSDRHVGITESRPLWMEDPVEAA